MSTPDSITAAATFKAAPVTLGRVTKWFRLLDRVGVTDLFDADARKEAPIPKPESPGEALRRKNAPAPVSFNLGHIMRLIASGNLLEELAEIVLVIPEGASLDDLDMQTLEEALVPFVRRSAMPLQMLTGSGVVSPGAAGGDGQASEVPTPQAPTGEA